METDIERRIGHLERTIQAQGTLLASNAEAVRKMEERSAERLEYLKERFDSIDARLERSDASGKYWTTTLLSVVFAVAISINYMYIEPIVEDVKALERRLLHHETNHSLAASDDPDDGVLGS